MQPMADRLNYDEIVAEAARLDRVDLERLGHALQILLAPMRLDRETVVEYAAKYDQRVAGKSDERVEQELRTWFRHDRFLDKEHFIMLGNWKSPRPRRLYEQNDALDIHAVTQTVIEHVPDEKLKIETLAITSRALAIEWP